MKVVQILGSPRAKGPSTRIANSFTKEAEKNGADVTSYTLNKMNYQGCQSCYACKGKIEECAVQDSLTETLRDIKDADIAVFATPVYFWDVSGQFKLMVDRFFLSSNPISTLTPNRAELLQVKQLS